MPQSKFNPHSGVWSPGAQPQADQPTLHLHTQDDPLRGRIESYIHQRYLRRYGARLKHWMPNLVCLQSNGEILAAAGYRDALTPLFLERYLSAPVEHYLRDDDLPVARSQIVEAGQFAAMRPGAGRLLVPMLARHLQERGFAWAVSTLTDELHHLFSRMGLAYQPLAEATAQSLDNADRKDWGNYYEHHPQVFAGKLSSILSRHSEHEA